MLCFTRNAVYPVSQSLNARPTLDSILISLFLDLSKSGQICNLNQPCPILELEILIVLKLSLFPKMSYEELSLLVRHCIPSIHGLCSLEERTSDLLVLSFDNVYQHKHFYPNWSLRSISNLSYPKGQCQITWEEMIYSFMGKCLKRLRIKSKDGQINQTLSYYYSELKCSGNTP